MRRSLSTQAQSTMSHCRLTSLTGDCQVDKLHEGHATGSRGIQYGWILSGSPRTCGRDLIEPSNGSMKVGSRTQASPHLTRCRLVCPAISTSVGMIIRFL